MKKKSHVSLRKHENFNVVLEVFAKRYNQITIP